MRIIVISMANRLLSGAIVKYLHERGELMPIQITDCSKEGEPCETCRAYGASVLLMEATLVPPFTLKERLESARMLRKTLPECKIALLCDDNADPDTAERIKDAKKIGLIDSFYYSSVSGEYISASLDAM